MNSETLFKSLERYKQLEEIEKELGIDLITLFKALKNETIWFRKYLGGDKYRITEVHHRGLHINKYTRELSIEDENGSLHLLMAYGKTWALTKEELSK